MLCRYIFICDLLYISKFALTGISSSYFWELGTGSDAIARHFKFALLLFVVSVLDPHLSHVVYRIVKNSSFLNIQGSLCWALYDSLFLKSGVKWVKKTPEDRLSDWNNVKSLAPLIMSTHWVGVYTSLFFLFAISVDPKSLSLGRNEWPVTGNLCWMCKWKKKSILHSNSHFTHCTHPNINKGW